MLSGGYSAVMQARDRDEFRDEIVRFARDLGFETVSAITVIDHGLNNREFVVVDNTPTAYIESSNDSTSYRRDPVMQHCKLQSLPIIWDQRTYVDNGVADLWEQMAGFGYRTGIAMALHMPEGRHFILGVDRDRDLPGDADELQRIVADLQLFAVLAQDAAMRILVPAPQQPERPALTPREVEALRWTMEGKTAWEVGAMMGITERTANLHVGSATHKLGCANKHQAVLKALRLGLIH